MTIIAVSSRYLKLNFPHALHAWVNLIHHLTGYPPHTHLSSMKSPFFLSLSIKSLLIFCTLVPFYCSELSPDFPACPSLHLPICAIIMYEIISIGLVRTSSVLGSFLEAGNANVNKTGRNIHFCMKLKIWEVVNKKLKKILKIWKVDDAIYKYKRLIVHLSD